MLDLGVQTATTMTTAGQPLQEGAALPHGAARLVRSGLCIAGDAFLVCLIGLPVNEARMMLRDQHCHSARGSLAIADRP